MAEPTPIPTVATVAPPTAASVYSAPNIQQAAFTPALPVNQALEDYNAFLNTPEIQSARGEVAKFQQAINAERAGLRNTTTGLEYQNDKAMGGTGASMNLIGRQVGRASELSTNRQAALGDSLSAAASYLQGLEGMRREQYNVYAQDKQRIQSLIAQTGNKAGIKTTDPYEVAVEKAYKWEKKNKEKEEKDALKDAIAKIGGSTKGKKGGSLSLKDLKKQYQKLTGAEYNKQQSRADQEWAWKVADHNKGNSSAKGSKITSLLTKAANMTSGGEAWAKKNAPLYGLKESDVTPYLKGNWGDGYRNSPETSQPNLIELGNGKLLDKNSGDIFEVD